MITSKHQLYELAAQHPTRDAKLLSAIAADAAPKLRATLLAEDFSGTAALSVAWCNLSPKHRAVATDIDKATLALAHTHERLTLFRADLTKPTRSRLRPHLIAVQNFSICELRSRPALVSYLKRCRSRLASGGLFVCDIYGGADAFTLGTLRDRVALPPSWPKGIKLHYEWQQRAADPLTGMVENAMHFEISLPKTQGVGAKPKRFADAFVYHWRLWSIPELRDALAEAGFSTTNVYPRIPGAIDDAGEFYIHPILDPIEVGDSFNVYVVAQR